MPVNQKAFIKLPLSVKKNLLSKNKEEKKKKNKKKDTTFSSRLNVFNVCVVIKLHDAKSLNLNAKLEFIGKRRTKVEWNKVNLK